MSFKMCQYREMEEELSVWECKRDVNSGSCVHPKGQVKILEREAEVFLKGEAWGDKCPGHWAAPA